MSSTFMKTSKNFFKIESNYANEPLLRRKKTKLKDEDCFLHFFPKKLPEGHFTGF